MTKIGKAVVLQNSTKEREITLNGLKFFVGLREGRRLLSAAHESKKLLNSAAAHLNANGYDAKVKKAKEPGLYLLEAREKAARGEDKWSEAVEKEEPEPAPTPKILPADDTEVT